jgi:hypothetical protein
MDLSSLLAVLAPIISGLAGQYGLLAQVLMWIGMLRLIMKPIMTCIQAVVDVTPTTKDNEILNGILNSIPYKVLSFLFDLVASLKLPKAAVVTPVATETQSPPSV